MSYVSQQFLFADGSSLTNFKNWGSAISAALSSMGWTQTSDTGQVNWSTISTVPTAGNFVYEIWQPGDALQTGSTKFFLKIFYGIGTGSPAGPRLKMQLCTSTDGAGNPTGITGQVYDSFGSGTGGSGTVGFECNFSGDTNRMGIMLYRNLNANNCSSAIFAVERTHNTDGTDSSDGVTLIAIGASGGMQTIVFGIGTAGEGIAGKNYYALYNGNAASDTFNNTIPISPTFPDQGKWGNPMTEIAWAHYQDVPEGAIVTTSLYGATRTYLATSGGPTGANATFSIALPSTSSNVRTLMRYD